MAKRTISLTIDSNILDEVKYVIKERGLSNYVESCLRDRISFDISKQDNNINILKQKKYLLENSKSKLFSELQAIDEELSKFEEEEEISKLKKLEEEKIKEEEKITCVICRERVNPKDSVETKKGQTHINCHLAAGVFSELIKK